MGLYHTRLFSVIVKVWIHEAEITTWHAQVTHIPSGEQTYVSRVEDLAAIMSRYLAVHGIRPGWWVRIWERIRNLPVR
jgi:hypothetical protein